MCRTLLARIFAVWALTMSLTACQKPVDLAAVRELHDRAAVAQTSFAALVQDYHDSCVRQTRWLVYLLGEQQQKASPKVDFIGAETRRRVADLETTLHAMIVSGSAGAPAQRRLHDEISRLRRQLQAAPSSRPATSDQGALKQTRAIYAALQSCDADINTQAMKKWSAWNRLLLGYYVALGDIAGKASDDSAYGVKDFANALKSDGAIGNDDQVKTVSSFAVSAIDAAFAARRTREIARFAGPDAPGTKFVDSITSALKDAAQTYIDTRLTPERRTVDVFYTTNIKQVPAGTEILTGLQGFIKSWDTDAGAVDAKVDAARTYMSALDDMRASHDAIAAAIASGKTDSLGNIVGVYLNQFAPEVEAIQKAFTEKPKK